MSTDVQVIASRLRRLAERGYSSEDLLEHAASCLVGELTSVRFIAVFREAFGVPIAELREIDAWVRTAEGLAGGISTAEAANVLRRYVDSYRQTA